MIAGVPDRLSAANKGSSGDGTDDCPDSTTVSGKG
jgi:hypothetical protein